MSEVYSNAFKSTRTITADGASIMWNIGGGSEGSSVPMLCSRINLIYQRTITPLTPVNRDEDESMINLVGRPSGQFNLTGILATNNSELVKFLQAVGRSCIDKDQHVTVIIHPYQVDQCVSDLRYTLKDVVMNRMDVDIQVQQGIAIVSKPLQFVFTSLDVDAEGANKRSSGGDGGNTPIINWSGSNLPGGGTFLA